MGPGLDKKAIEELLSKMVKLREEEQRPKRTHVKTAPH